MTVTDTTDAKARQRVEQFRSLVLEAQRDRVRRYGTDRQAADQALIDARQALRDAIASDPIVQAFVHLRACELNTYYLQQSAAQAAQAIGHAGTRIEAPFTSPSLPNDVDTTVANVVAELIGEARATVGNRHSDDMTVATAMGLTPDERTLHDTLLRQEEHQQQIDHALANPGSINAAGMTAQQRKDAGLPT